MPRFVTDSRPTARSTCSPSFTEKSSSNISRCLQAAASLLLRERDHRRRSRPRPHHGQARTTLHARQRPTARQLAPQEIRRRHRPFGLVRPQANTLTRSLPDASNDLLAIVRAGIAAVDAGPLVDARARVRRRAMLASDARRVRSIAAGKAAPAMADAAARRSAPACAAVLVIAPTATLTCRRLRARSSAAIRCRLRRASAPGAARSKSPRSLPAGRAAARAAVRRRLGADGGARRRRDARRQARDDRAAAAGRRRHPRAEHRSQASVGDQGRLACRARRAAGATTLAISDVVGDDPSVIASGPTVADPTTFADALDVLRRFGGEAAYPAAVVAHLRRGARRRHAGNAEAGRSRGSRARATTVIGGAAQRDGRRGARGRDARLHTSAARRSGRRRGPRRRPSRTCARVLARAAGSARPACIVSSGETTVHVTGRGRGGRNQEFALAAAGLLARSRWPRSSPASAPTASTVRPMPPARSRTRRLSTRAHSRRPRARALPFSTTTTPTRFSTRSAISSTPVRPARTSATFK